MTTNVALIAGAGAGLAALAYGIFIMLNRDKPLKGGGIGAIGILAIMACWAMNGSEQEITAAQYAQVRTWVAADPRVRSAMAGAMADGRVDVGEFDAIRDVAASDALIAQRDGLRRQLTAARTD